MISGQNSSLIGRQIMSNPAQLMDIRVASDFRWALLAGGRVPRGGAGASFAV